VGRPNVRSVLCVRVDKFEGSIRCVIDMTWLIIEKNVTIGVDQIKEMRAEIAKLQIRIAENKRIIEELMNRECMCGKSKDVD
jgi:hypothetical protein